MAKNTGKDKSLSEKLKSFLGFKEQPPMSFDHLKTEPYHISAEIMRDLFPENPISVRLKPLKELCGIVMTKRLEENAIESMFGATRDMVQPPNTLETRHMVLQFYYCIIQGQLEKMATMRNQFFRFIVTHKNQEDSSVRLELLKALSQNGTTITYFEEEIGPILLLWYPEMLLLGKCIEFLPLVVNFIKHNAAYLDDGIVAGFLRHTCKHCSNTDIEEDIQLCLDVMDAVLCYSHLPLIVLKHVVFALCLKVNMEKFSQVCWKLMRNLVGTSLGHSTLYTLCIFLQEKNEHYVPSVLRGAVFFIGMALWGSNKVEISIDSPSTVLPSFRKALDYNNNIIAYEVALSVQRLVKKNGRQLQMSCWQLVLDIIEILLKYPELQPSQFPMPLATCVHELITAVEEMNVSYCLDRLYNIVEGCSDRRDEESVIRLVSHRFEFIHPIKEDFIPCINHLLEKYFKNEKRQAVQLKALEVTRNIRVVNARFFQDDAIDQTILTYLSNVDAIPDVIVRKGIVELLLEISEICINERYFDILNVVEKVLKYHFEAPTEVESPNLSAKRRMGCPDVEAAVRGLIKAFEKKLHMLPSSHCVRIYNMLVNHITLHYSHLSYSDGNTKIRRMILDFFLKIRSNYKKQVGIAVDGHVNYSAYVLCNTMDLMSDSGPAVSPGPNFNAAFNFFPLAITFDEMFQVLIGALKQEKDWLLLEILFQKLPVLLENKPLVMSGKCNINTVCRTLCSMINDKSYGYHENLHNAPPRFTRTELQSRVFPVIACLAAYHSEMESHMQTMLIRCLQAGLVSSSAKVCIHGLTLCTLEMRNMMVKHMPSVLSKLSQISATVTVAVAMLEFLSNLIRLPPLYVSFVEDQYRSIFAIALPYTNPHKFNQYTVALAHHVIAMWFLKCRIPFRKEFAKFITKGLRSNMSLPFDDVHGSSSAKSDSSSAGNASNESTVTLHADLLEIGLDLMARFTFGMSTSAPKRSVVADFLLEKGQKSSWMIGNKIITITTSGCGTKAFKYGLCERCYSYCRKISNTVGSDDGDSVEAATPEPPEEPSSPPPQPPPSERRRHRSAFHRRNTTLSEKLKSTASTKDDIRLHREKSSLKKPLIRRSVSHATPSVPESGSDNRPIEEDNKGNSYQLCSCWCSGWAEIHIRRPTNTSSWMMRIQNPIFLPTSPPNIPLPAISSLLLPYKPETTADAQSSSVAESEIRSANESGEEDTSVTEEDVITSATSEALTCPKPKIPLRRTNSSPDMNSGWATYNAAISQRPCLHSSVTVEEPALLDSNSGEIFHFEEKEEERKPITENVAGYASRAAHRRSKTNTNLELDLSSAAQRMEGLHQFHADDESANPSGSFRGRVHTISVMSPNRSVASGSLPVSQRNKDLHRSGLNPSFVFLQLYHDSCFGDTSQKPLLIRQTEQNIRSLSVIDHIHPYDTHKIGVVYVGKGQMNDEQAILSNVYGSVRYVEFLKGLGNVVRLSSVDQELTYVGGLDLRGEDGKFALVWHDDVMRVAFHVATLLPNRKDDPKRNNKKTHVGNNFVTIVYNESNEDYDINTIKSQFTRACVIIRPEDNKCNVVTAKVKSKELRDTFGHDEAHIVSDSSLPIFVRQMALHANLASLILDPRQQSAHVSNWLARLRAIKRLRSKLLDEKLKSDSARNETQSDFFIDDFTEYV